MSTKIKVTMIGDKSVGKSSLAHLCNLGTELYTDEGTIGFDILKKEFIFENKNIVVEIWDTAGEERFRSVFAPYYRKSDAVFMIYNITDRKTFSSLEYWINETNKYVEDSATRFILGNKNDLEVNRAVTMEEGQKFAEWQNMQFYETFKGDPHMQTIFVKVLKQIAKEKNDEISSRNISLPETPIKEPEKKSCCNSNVFNFNLTTWW